MAASRTAPVIMAIPSGSDPVQCSTKTPALVSQAVITVTGDWAEVSVPRCAVASTGADEFRLIHFEERWRVIGIRLFQEPLAVTADR